MEARVEGDPRDVAEQLDPAEIPMEPIVAFDPRLRRAHDVCTLDDRMSAQARASRWNLRVAQDDDFVVRKAADESDRELSEFVRSAAVQEAERILADRTVFTLNEEKWDRFNAILERPPRVPAGLKRLFSKPSVFE